MRGLELRIDEVTRRRVLAEDLVAGSWSLPAQLLGSAAACGASRASIAIDRRGFQADFPGAILDFNAAQDLADLSVGRIAQGGLDRLEAGPWRGLLVALGKGFNFEICIDPLRLSLQDRRFDAWRARAALARAVQVTSIEVRLNAKLLATGLGRARLLWRIDETIGDGARLEQIGLGGLSRQRLWLKYGGSLVCRAIVRSGLPLEAVLELEDLEGSTPDPRQLRRLAGSVLRSIEDRAVKLVASSALEPLDHKSRAVVASFVAAAAASGRGETLGALKAFELRQSQGTSWVSLDEIAERSELSVAEPGQTPRIDGGGVLMIDRVGRRHLEAWLQRSLPTSLARRRIRPFWAFLSGRGARRGQR